jgi:ABC-type lipoprotein release transport system permease subunit
VATSVAVLSGALLVGHSVRASLRDLVVQRLGGTDVVVVSDRFFREELSDAIASAAGAGSTTSCPIIRLQGVMAHARDSRRTRTVQVYGVDERFWRFHGAAREGPDGRAAFVGEDLAEALAVQPGDDVLLRIETADWIPRESLYGKREETGRTLRLTCDVVVPANALGGFALQPSQDRALTVFVPLSRLQRDLAQPSWINAVLVGSSRGAIEPDNVRAALARVFSLQDVGVSIRPLPSRAGAAVGSARILLDESLSRAAFEVAREGGFAASGVFSYLANTIRANGREIPYSLITAADLGEGALTAVGRVGAGAAAAIPPEESIWLNEWAWRDLRASPGDRVDVEYYRWQEGGRLSTETARFRLAGVVSIGGDADASMAPDVPGVSGVKDIRAWEPPFPMDLRRIRPPDEDYWHRFGATPKAFVSLARGQQLWGSRFGTLTSVRLALPDDGAAAAQRSTADPTDVPDAVAEALRGRLDPEAAGFSIIPVRARGLAASEGATDFGEYFVYFSFFLITAAVLLAALFFRLGIEQRAREIGTLRALGFPAATIRWLFLAEGAALAGAGSLLGIAGAVGYGELLVAGLRTWWIGATGTNQVVLHVAARELAAGAAGGVTAALLAVLWSLRALRQAPATLMLAGVMESGVARLRRARGYAWGGGVAFAAALALLGGAAAGPVPQAAAFFAAGVLLLISMLSLTAVYLRKTRAHELSGSGWAALVRLGARHVSYRPGRSLLSVALIAFATFVIVSVEAFRRDPGESSLARNSGTGGFPLIAQAAFPIVGDPNSEAGREALGISTVDHPAFAGVRFVPFRERPGEDASCLNLYSPQEPRILGATPGFVREARFTFQASLATTDDAAQNPWMLLDSAQPDGAIPTIADATTIQYVLHRSLGDQIVVRGDNGAPVRLRLVGALRDTVLQGAMIVGEADFLRVFPDREGFRFFFLDAPPEDAPALVRPLEEALADWGMVVERSSDRLAAYHRVENTYLSTFQTLGILGLALGTFGLAAIVLRNVLERRRELALLRAVGYRGRALSLIIVVETVLLMAGGVVCGSVCAMLAIVPALVARGGSPPLAAAGAMLAAIVAAGLLASLAAAIAVRRMPLLESLRSE